MPAQPNQPAVEYGTTWGPKPAGDYHDLTVTSGGVVQVKKLGVPELISSGLLEQFDTLGLLMDEKVISPVKKPMDRQPKKPTKAEQAAADQAQEAKLGEQLMKDPSKLADLIKMMDQVTAACVVTPVVVSCWMMDDATGKLVEIPPSERVEGTIYTDSIDFVDKMDVLNWAMGGFSLGQLAAFRN